MPEELKLRVSRETRDVLAPIAGRLGIQWIRIQLEDAAFEVLEPKTYHELKDAIESDRSKRKTFVDHILRDLQAMVLPVIPNAKNLRARKASYVYAPENDSQENPAGRGFRPVGVPHSGR